MTPDIVPPDEYTASLPRKRVAAVAVFRGGQGRVLLTVPDYKPGCDLPGGAVEVGESPHAACRREVSEELGLDLPPGRIVAVDWVPARGQRPEAIVVVYDGGVLTKEQEAAIIPRPGELAGIRWAHPAEIEELTSPLVGGRITASLSAVATGTVAALENGQPADGAVPPTAAVNLRLWDAARSLHLHHDEAAPEMGALKLAEGVEAAAALIGTNGKRNGVCASQSDVLDQLSDVIITAATVAMTGIAGDTDTAGAHFTRHLRKVLAQAGLGAAGAP